MASSKNDWIPVINEHIKTMRADTTSKKIDDTRRGRISMKRFDKVCASKRDDLVDSVIKEVAKHIPEDMAEDVSNGSLGLRCEIENHEEDTYGEFIMLLVEAVEDLTQRLEEQLDQN